MRMFVPVFILLSLGPNSNSLAHWLLESGYLDQDFTAPLKTTGWNNPRYGTISGN
jgi:hypothetical protein